MNNDYKRFREIKKHFSSEAGEFDSIITDRIPFYGLFIKALVNILPFKKDEAIKVVDLGCGTGTVAYHVKEKFSNAEVACVDFSPEMLASARKKLGRYTNIFYYASDVLEFDFTGYDAVLSSLCLHHIGSEKEKKDFFKKVYKEISQEGVFYIYDVVLASNGALHDVCLEEWKRYMGERLSPEDIEETVRKYRREDRPFALMDELKWLEEAGFKDVDVICKFYNGAVYGGIK
ncbi:MAG: methyltransferase domain-containing protein [Candidatus Ratteibacteria bacterium]|jgi:tRNA (cmo5U34)-methyltransferase